ncbi:hypothetical protein M422DRAFT_182023 [Sphaerobolus stellatus SS14]|uniref:NAD(P)-binding protein n=1 Tax=Sphaerobolus stellatus (strain SS14) TaxID=990650 RepID=A0A0C9VAP8_SPHS4|nr:hypothetical protein M422DRAFT_182023 [Sphaerobolus stellatus SS14]
MSPSLQTVRAFNDSYKFASSPTSIPIAVFVGGTSGIGRAIAEAFAQHTRGNAKIILVGRKKAAADEIIAGFPKPSNKDLQIEHEFVQCDAMLMKDIKRVTTDLVARLSKINYLVLTVGIYSVSPRDPTPEGIDKMLAVHYYARWKFTFDLLPLLHKAKNQQEDAKVFSLLACGRSRPIDVDDFAMENGYTSLRAIGAGPTYNDLAFEEFAIRNPSITFFHAGPGIVLTNLANNSPSPLLSFFAPVINVVMYPFSMSPAESGEHLLYGMLAHPNESGSKGSLETEGFFRIGSKGQDLKREGYIGGKMEREKLWEHTEKVVSV